jgi:uncharacterized protein YydD (DUF2326 family)
MTEPIPLREYLERALTDYIRYHEALHADHSLAHGREHMMYQEAIQKAEEAMTARLEGMNEFRQQLTAERALYVTRDQIDARDKALDAQLEHLQAAMTESMRQLALRVSALEQYRAHMEGRLVMLGIAFTILVFVVNVALRFIS